MKVLVANRMRMLLSLLIILVGCNKDHDAIEAPEPPISEFPMEGLLSGLERTNVETNTGFLMEFGFEFTPLVRGTLKSIVVNLPETDDYRVTLWDAERKEQILSATVMATAETLTASVELSLELHQNKEYAVTVRSEHWFRYQKPNGSAFLPLEVNHIEILNYAENVVNIQSQPSLMLYPDFFHDDFLQGKIDIEFIPNN